MKRFFSTAILVLALCLAAWGQGVQERCERRAMKFRGLEREYYLYKPDSLRDGAPLVIVLHGYGGSALKGKAGMMDAADRHSFAVCYPQGEKDPKGKTGWNVGYPPQEGMETDDVKYVCALADRLCKENGFNRRNTFLAGMSNGGEMCYLTAMRKPQAFKAFASIAGLTMAWMADKYSYTSPVPFMEVHGTEDRTSEWYGDPANAGGWGAYLPVPVAIARIVAADGCTGEVVSELPRREGGGKVILYRFTGGKPVRKGGKPTEVWLYEVQGGTHSWAEKDMDTYEEIWRFFSRWID